MATPNISIHELLGLWPTLLRSDMCVRVCVCVCVCTKADLFHHKISSYYIYMVPIASVEETI